MHSAVWPPFPPTEAYRPSVSIFALPDRAVLFIYFPQAFISWLLFRELSSSFVFYRKHFGSRYVIMELPPSMPCSGDSPNSTCSPKVGGIGYARHFIQQWSSANNIPFVWVLDDNVQLCHELDVEAGEGEYKPCSFTHVMDSLERLVLAETKENIRARTAPDAQSKTRSVRDYARDHINDKGSPGKACPLTCPLRKPYRLPAGNKPREWPPSGDGDIITVGDMCGRPGQYGVIGIARHGHSRKTIEETAQVDPFGVTHSAYSFYLLNVESTVSKGALYPMKRYWEDIEFNHIVEEKGLLVCVFRKFSHSKKNLQPVQTRQQQTAPPAPPAPLARRPPPEFQHEEIDLTALQRMYENDSAFVTKHMNGLLEYLAKQVLKGTRVSDVLYPQADGFCVRTCGGPFEIEPAVPIPASHKIALETVDDDDGSMVIMLLGGIRNESFGVLKGVITEEVRAICGENGGESNALDLLPHLESCLTAITVRFRSLVRFSAGITQRRSL